MHDLDLSDLDQTRAVVRHLPAYYDIAAFDLYRNHRWVNWFTGSQDVGDVRVGAKAYLVAGSVPETIQGA